ncbi:mobile mystery protein A [Rickettsiales bacterium]|nr:mobile mystery protein A [Rickettsiales bacterium]
MSDKLKHLQIQTLDRHIAEIRVCDRPSDGWIAAIRKSLGMSVRQLAERIGITQQSTARLETNETDDSITLKSLRKAAEALDCRVVYALIPNEGSLEVTIRKQAIKKASELVKDVDHTMQLEAQGVGNVDAKIKELAEDLAKNPNSKLWD